MAKKDVEAEVEAVDVVETSAPVESELKKLTEKKPAEKKSEKKTDDKKAEKKEDKKVEVKKVAEKKSEKTVEKKETAKVVAVTGSAVVRNIKIYARPIASAPTSIYTGIVTIKGTIGDFTTVAFKTPGSAFAITGYILTKEIA